MATNSTHSMGDIMSDSECSEMTESSSAASSSASDSEQSSQSLEPVRILKQNLELPKSLCENPNVFHEFFSLETWKCLPDHMQDQLKAFLPRFDGNATSDTDEQMEMNATLQKLFTNQITRFGASPLIDFQRNLEEGNYRPDISRLRANIRKSQRREQRFQQSERVSRLAKALVVSREKLLRAAYDGTNCQAIISMADKVTNDVPKLTSTAAAERAKKRYFEEISSIMDEVGLDLQLSDDENYPEGPPMHLTRKQRKYLSGTQYGALSPGSEPRIISTMSMRNSANADKALGQHCSTTMTDDAYRQLLAQHKMRKIEDADHPDLDTADIKLGDIYVRTQNAAGRRPLLLPKQTATSKKAQVAAAAAAATMSAATISSPASVKVESDAIKVESEITIATIDEQSSLELPALDAQHLDLSQSYLNDSDQAAALEAIKYEEENDENIEVKVEVKTEAIKTEPPSALPATIASTKSIHAMNAIFGGETKGKKRPNAASIQIPADRSPKKPLLTPNSAVIDEPQQRQSIHSQQPHQPSQQQQQQLQATPSTVVKVGDKMLGNDVATVVTTAGNVSTMPITGTVTIANYSGKQMKAATLSDLEGIDMMHLPVDLDDSGGNIDILSDIDMKPELVQETHACFLSLIRDIFCSTPDHRTTAENLRARVSTWLANPLTALNDWFSEADSWLALLTSAIHFLAGEFIDQPDEFVPYVEYKANLHIYQWIGAGRDNDQHLRPLCDYWLKRRNEMGTKPPPKNAAQNESLRGKSPRALAQSHVQQRNPSRNHTFDIDLEDSLSSGGGGGNSSSYERVASPPPPRFPTEWTVQKATPEEIFEFREQERRRFDSPHLSFCYRMHGYESVVGPVKGIYTQIPALTKARGHNMLTVDRPNFVTILTLVRDATARLPNGEGTRADICELLKSSQYICPTAAENVLQTIVSGALDRMHTEHDPCVRYDAKRKIWIYLHRNRTEEEFDRMHQQYQGHSKHKKQTTRKNKSLKTAATLSKSPNEILSSDSTPIDQAPSPSMFTAKTKCVTRVVTPTASISPTSSIAAQVHVSTSATSPPLPALSSIQVSPTLTNKMITVQKMPLTKPELVPIQVAHDTQLEPIEVEATHEVSTSSPVTVQKPSPRITMQLPSLIVDKTTSKMGAAKPVGKPTLNLIASNSTQIKVSTPSGIQTVHVSAAGHALIKPPMTTILTPSSTQSILSANQVQNRSQSPLRVAKTQQQLLQSKVQPPPLIAQSTPPNVSSYMIPISLSGKTVQSASIIKSISPTIAVAPKITKTTTLPALTNAHVPRMSLLQTQQPQQTQSTPTSINVNLNKTIIRNASAVPAGKSLISPTLQQQSATLKKQICSISASDLIFQQQQQQTPKFIMASAAPVVSKTNLVTTSQANAPMVVQKIMAVSKAASGSTATSTAVGTITPPGTSLINPHIIQIHQTNQKTAQTLSGTGAKVPVGFCETTPRKPTLGLTPAQQQNLLQSIKQRAQSSPQSLIIKQQQVLQQIQKQMQQPTTQIQLTSPPKSVGTAAGTSLLGTQIQLTSNPSTSMIITGGTTTQPTITRTVKAGTSLIQQANQTATTTTQLTTSPITAVRTVSANNPLVGKVLTDASGQIISLESLLQKQVTVNSAPTLRLTGSKPGQTTNLIQLAGTPGSQITQYAVVSQGRNLISMAQPRVITTQAGGIVTSNAATATINSSGQLVAVSGVKTVGGISVLSSTATSNSPKTDIVKIGGRNVVNSKFKTMVAATTTSTAATQPVMRYKTTGGTSIRIMNASNLIHIGGKPVIIASKSSGTTLLGQSANQTAQQHATASAVFRKYSGSGTSSSGTVTSTANTNNFVIGGQMVKVQGNFDQSATTVGTTGGVQSTGTAQNVMFGNQIVKLQAHQPTSQQLQTKTIVSSSGVVGTSNGATTPTRTVVLSSSGQTLKVHSPTVISTPSSVANSAGGTKVTVATSSLPSTQQVVLGSSNLKNVIKGTNLTASPGQRVVLAVQGGGQILLPPNFHGGSINLKSLQGLKMIPIQQSQASQIQQNQQIVNNAQVTRAPNSATGDS